MQLKLTSILSEIGVIATVGVGYMLVKNKLNQKSVGYEDYEYISTTTFPCVLDKFKGLEDDTAFETLLNELEEFLKLADRVTHGSDMPGNMLFQMNRLSQSIAKNATNMCLHARHCKNPDTVVYAIDCEQDELNLLTATCDDILRNVLLDIAR
jgi:hypothetical protein